VLQLMSIFDCFQEDFLNNIFGGGFILDFSFHEADQIVKQRRPMCCWRLHRLKVIGALTQCPPERMQVIC
jgi:hypothetical protein